MIRASKQGVGLSADPLSGHAKPEKMLSPALNDHLMPAHHRLRFELLFALGAIAFGALVLPALVYAVGVVLLGTYADGGLGSFYANLYRDLATGSLAAAAIVFGPYVILLASRLPLLGWRRAQHPDEDTEKSATPPARSGRVEPRIGH